MRFQCLETECYAASTRTYDVTCDAKNAYKPLVVNLNMIKIMKKCHEQDTYLLL